MTFQGEFGDSCAENGESEGEREGPGAAGASSECSGAFSGFSADDAGHPIVFFFIQTVAQQHEIDLHLIFQGDILYFFSVHLRGMIDALMSERNITMFNSNGYYNVL